jgi:AcrR family transcriptional regulator
VDGLQYRQYGNTVSTKTLDRPRLRARRTRSEAREDNRRALLAAAKELIVEVGYVSAQLDEIADRAGLTKGAVYSIFGGKLELLRAVVSEHAEQMRPMLELPVEAAPSTTAEDLVRSLVHTYVDFLSRQDAVRLLAFELDLAGLALRDAATLELIRGHERAAAQRLARALTGRPRSAGAPLDANEAALAADIVLGALGGVGQRLVTATWMGRDADAIADAVARLLPPGQGEVQPPAPQGGRPGLSRRRP